MARAEKYQLLPELGPEQFEALKADIAERGVIVPVLLDEYGAIIDGHNRARACRELGINDYPTEVRAGLTEFEKRALARKLNVLRRHLTRDQVRALIAEQLKDTPSWSNHRLAGELGVDDKTVATVREGLTATSEIPKLDRLVGADGKDRPVRQPRKKARRARAVRDDDDLDDDLDDDDLDVDVDPEWKRAGWGDPVKKAKLDHAVGLMEAGVDPNSEKVRALLREAAVSMIETPGYDPCANMTEEQRVEWHLFMLFLSHDAEAGRPGYSPQGAAAHVEYVLQKQFQNVAEWLGDEGDKFRRECCGMKRMPAKTFKRRWTAFHAEHDGWGLADVVAKLEELQRKCDGFRPPAPRQAAKAKTGRRIGRTRSASASASKNGNGRALSNRRS